MKKLLFLLVSVFTLLVVLSCKKDDEVEVITGPSYSEFLGTSWHSGVNLENGEPESILKINSNGRTTLEKRRYDSRNKEVVVSISYSMNCYKELDTKDVPGFYLENGIVTYIPISKTEFGLWIDTKKTIMGISGFVDQFKFIKD